MAFAMIKKQNKCIVPYYVSYCCRVFGRTWGITVNSYGCNDTLLPPLANTWKVRDLKLLFPSWHNITLCVQEWFLFLCKISRDSGPDFDAIRCKYNYAFTQVIFFYICLTSEADRKELQCHASCSVFQVLICLKSKNEKSGILVLSLVLDVPIPHFC